MENNYNNQYKQINGASNCKVDINITINIYDNTKQVKNKIEDDIKEIKPINKNDYIEKLNKCLNDIMDCTSHTNINPKYIPNSSISTINTVVNNVSERIFAFHGLISIIFISDFRGSSKEAFKQILQRSFNNLSCSITSFMLTFNTDKLILESNIKKISDILDEAFQ